MQASADRSGQGGGGEHLSGYQARDYEVVDYRMQQLAGTGLWFRGPQPDLSAPGGYFACLGAAQTLGCFCQTPFPDLLARDLGMPALNLGYGGAGPEFFVNHPELLAHVNRARFAVLQVMSARSQSNSYYRCGGLEYVTLTGSGDRMGAAEAFGRLLRGPSAVARLPVAGRRLARMIARPRAEALVTEIRAAWVDSMQALLDRIEVPVILLWFSKRTPDYRESYANARRLFGEFPHLVTPAMLAPLRGRVAAYVECVSDRGSPQPLVSRFTGQPVSVDTARDRPDLAGKPWTANHYYPSPEMHEDAAAALIGACRALAGAA